MRRIPTLVAALAVCLALAACSSSSSSGPSTSPAPTSSAVASGAPVPPAKLTALLKHGLAGVGSVHLALRTQVTGSPAVAGSGDVTLRDGAISGAELTEALPGGLGSVRIVVADGKTYARLPAGLTKAARPWLVLSTSSSQPLVAQLASTVDSVLSVASPTTVVSLVRVASGVRDLGAATVGGATARHYLVTIAASQLSTLSGGLSAGSARSVAVDVYVGPSGRPVRLAGSLELSGSRVTPTVTLSRYGEQTSITAPPASQVAG